MKVVGVLFENDEKVYYLDALDFNLKNNLNNMPIRFDVIEVYLKEDKINHIVNAF